MNYCTFVQWVPGSDVVVAQTKDNMGIWYNIDAPERVTLLPIKGDIIDIAREEGEKNSYFFANFFDNFYDSLNNYLCQRYGKLAQICKNCNIEKIFLFR